MEYGELPTCEYLLLKPHPGKVGEIKSVVDAFNNVGDKEIFIALAGGIYGTDGIARLKREYYPLCKKMKRPCDVIISPVMVMKQRKDFDLYVEFPHIAMGTSMMAGCKKREVSGDTESGLLEVDKFLLKHIDVSRDE